MKCSRNTPPSNANLPLNKLLRKQSPHLGNDERWRPGRSKENEEYNLSQRAQPMEMGNSKDFPVHDTRQHGATVIPHTKSVVEDNHPQRGSRRPISPGWKPPLAVGASLGEGLSRMEEADRLVMQWEAIIANARKNQPNADLSSFETRLERARRERDAMEETEENIVQVEELESTKRERIHRRIKKLETVLERNSSSVAQINIQAAIDAYKNGGIPFSDKWTLIYAGKLVDRCPTFQSFTLDREERLDRYFQEHGEGWLWYEPPLASSNNVPKHLFAATWAHAAYAGDGLWCGTANTLHITMGFRRVRMFHSRRAQTKVKVEEKSGGHSPVPPPSKILDYLPNGTPFNKQQARGFEIAAYDDPDGPRCFFLMHLDSGASLPTLHRSDLALLGIDPDVYPAQTEIEMSTANGQIDTPLYELRVDVCRHNGESLVGSDPVWPQERHELGGIIPVSIMPGTDISLIEESGALTTEIVREREDQNIDVSEGALASREKSMYETRLSGLLPFQVCYSAGAPGKNLWFGEDRRDVLGADRMPGQVRHEWHKPALMMGGGPVDVGKLELDRPKFLAFEHEMGPGRRLRDADIADRPGASMTSLIGPTSVESFVLEPRKLRVKEAPKRKSEQEDDVSAKRGKMI